MKESNMDIFENPKLVKFKDDPEWFKKTILKACTRNNSGEIGHIEYMEQVDFKTRPIVTTLKYLRAIVPDSIDPLDDKLEVEAKNINDDTCIILIVNDNGEYIEPLSGFQVSDPGLQGYSPKEIYDYTIGSETYLMLDFSNGGFSSFGYVTDEIIELWTKDTVPYEEEIKSHFEKLKKRTENNFGESFNGTEKIEEVLNSLKKQKI